MADKITEDNFENNNQNSINYNQNENNVQLEEENFLRNYEFKSLSPNNNNSKTIENEFQSISNHINQEKISNIKVSYNNRRISDIYQDYFKLKDSNIGSLVPFKHYIHSKFCSEENYTELLDLDISNIEIDKFRKIKGDGNCFYRSYIFSFIENIILTNNIILMKEIFIIFNNFSLNDLTRNYNINFEEIKIILYIIIDFMQTDNNNSTAFMFFQKAELFSETFDTGIVLFMRYLIKEYLFLNKNKNYGIQSNMPIRCLFPNEYKRGDVYLFDEYYNNDLMKMNVEAKSIAVYVSPYVLNCDLNIFELKYDEQNNMIICPNNCYKSNGNSFFIINLIYDSKIMHYDSAYTKSFYEQYKNYFRVLTESIYPQFLNDQILEQQINILYSKYLEAQFLLLI